MAASCVCCWTMQSSKSSQSQRGCLYSSSSSSLHVIGMSCCQFQPCLTGQSNRMDDVISSLSLLFGLCHPCCHLQSLVGHAENKEKLLSRYQWVGRRVFFKSTPTTTMKHGHHLHLLCTAARTLKPSSTSSSNGLRSSLRSKGGIVAPRRYQSSSSNSNGNDTQKAPWMCE